MCGLCGEIRFRGHSGLCANEAMANAMHARGPDSGGFFAQGNIALGHRRLSILDLSAASQQPMVDSELGLALVFNGCIYNFRALRGELEAKGYRFFSDGDTEVIIKAYDAWGPRCVERFHGMFAFAIWERDSGRVVLARDRLGIKPLYLADVDSGRALRFASTLPALLAAGGVNTGIDPAGLHHYMSFHAVVPAPRTILQGVRKLPPATIMTIEPDGTRREEVYWSVDVGASDDDRGDRRNGVARARPGGDEDGGRAAARRRRAGRGSAVGRSRQFAGGGAVGRVRPTGPQDILRRLRKRRRSAGRRVRVFRLDRRAVRHRPSPHSHRWFAGARRAAAGDRGDVGADDEPRRDRLLPAVRGSLPLRQGGAERPGRRRNLRRLSLVSAHDAGQRRGGRICPGLFRPRSCGDARDADAVADERRLQPRLRGGVLCADALDAAGRPGPAARYARSCWSTIRSSGSTT